MFNSHNPPIVLGLAVNAFHGLLLGSDNQIYDSKSQAPGAKDQFWEQVRANGRR